MSIINFNYYKSNKKVTWVTKKCNLYKMSNTYKYLGCGLVNFQLFITKMQ